MVTDDERREVAERLRKAEVYTLVGKRNDGLTLEWNVALISELAEAIGLAADDEFSVFDRLADLIEPSDTSQSCRDTVACGIDSIYDWCFAAIEGADGAEDHLYCSIMSAIEEYRHPERVTARTARLVDREALLALADEMVEMFRIGAFTGEGIDRSWCRELYDKYAKHVREARGEAS